MSAQPVPPGPIESLRRGLLSLRANWQLAPLLLLQSLLTLGLTLAGVLILLGGLGVSVIAWLRGLGPDWPQQVADDLRAALEMAEPAAPALLPLVAPLLGATLVWTLAFGLYCYLQGGVAGVLVDGELAAGAGGAGWRDFRRFSGASFDRHGRRLFWPYFWLAHIVGAALLGWLLLLTGLVVLAVRLATGPATTAGIAVGCVGLAPLALTLFAISIWAMLAMVEVARPGATAWQASRRALGQMRRRLGGVLLIWILFNAGLLMIGAAFTPLDWAVSMTTGDRLAALLGGHVALTLLELLAHCALAVALIGTLASYLDLRAGGSTSGEPVSGDPSEAPAEVAG